LNPVFLTPVTVAILVIIVFAYKNKQYKKGAYYKITKNPYLSVKFDKGKDGEYLTYKSLRHLKIMVANSYLIFTFQKKIIKKPKLMCF